MKFIIKKIPFLSLAFILFFCLFFPSHLFAANKPTITLAQGAIIANTDGSHTVSFTVNCSPSTSEKLSAECRKFNLVDDNCDSIKYDASIDSNAPNGYYLKDSGTRSFGGTCSLASTKTTYKINVQATLSDNSKVLATSALSGTLNSTSTSGGAAGSNNPVSAPALGTLTAFIRNIANILRWLIIGAAAMSFALGAFFYMTSMGDAKKIAKAKEYFIGSITALLALVFAFVFFK